MMDVPVAAGESLERLRVAVRQAGRGAWTAVLTSVGDDLPAHPYLPWAVQATSLRVNALWHTGAVEAASREGLAVLELDGDAHGERDRPDSAAFRHFLSFAVHPTLAALRADIRTSAAAQLRLIDGVFSALERTGPGLETVLRAERRLEEGLALVYANRLDEARWRLDHLHRLLEEADTEGDASASATVRDCTEQLLYHVALAVPTSAEASDLTHPLLRAWMDAWTRPRAVLLDAGGGGEWSTQRLLRWWTTGTQAGFADAGARPGWCLAAVGWGSQEPSVRAAAVAPLGDVLDERDVTTALRTHLPAMAARAIGEWVERPDAERLRRVGQHLGDTSWTRWIVG